MARSRTVGLVSRKIENEEQEDTFNHCKTPTDHMTATSSTSRHPHRPPSSKSLTPALKRARSSIYLISSGESIPKTTSFNSQMLINWFVSAFAEDHYLRQNLKTSDLRLLAAQFCTHLLAAGVLRQLPDKDVPQAEALFRPDLIYFWSHTEAVNAAPPTPGRLTSVAWPPPLSPSSLQGQDIEIQYNGKSTTLANLNEMNPTMFKRGPITPQDFHGDNSYRPPCMYLKIISTTLEGRDMQTKLILVENSIGTMTINLSRLNESPLVTTVSLQRSRGTSSAKRVSPEAKDAPCIP
ncbi:Fmn2p [Homalodisca vitripennis]|nr:Fmn2p [Homalodisca vitripennis]